MNFLPLVSRELRVATRRRYACRVRMAIAGGSMCLSYWALLVWGVWQSGAALGHAILSALALAGFIGGALSGVFLTADCLSMERREGTLGLLFLTDLRTHDVVFGKLAAKAIIPFHAGLALAPALAVCVIVGGVTGAEFWRICLVLMNTLFFSLAGTILTSSLCQTQRFAYSMALLFLLLSLGVLPLAGVILSFWSKSSLWEHLSYLVSPIGSYLLAFDKPYQGAARWFWGSLAATHLLSWSCLILTCFVLPHQWQDKPVAPSRWSGRLSRLALRWPFGRVMNRENLAQKLMAGNPVAWLGVRQNLKSQFIWSLPALAVWLGMSNDLNPFGNRQSQAGFAALFLIHALFTLWLTADAAHTFAADRRSGALELLLGTSLSVREIATGAMSAFRRRFLAPAFVLVLADVLCALRSFSTGGASGAFWLCALALMFLIDAYCLIWVALWRGLLDRNSALATLSTAGRLLILPWMVFAGAVIIFSQSSHAELAILRLAVCGVQDIIFLSHAKNGLLEHFRVLALRPFGAKAPHIESQWSAMNWESEVDEKLMP
jgi:hypothetical protein